MIWIFLRIPKITLESSMIDCTSVARTRRKHSGVKESNDTFIEFVFITFCFKSYVSFIYNIASKVAFRDLKFYGQ